MGADKVAGRPRLPQAVAKVTGAAAKNPQRFRDRASPKVPPIGAAPKHFNKDQREAWDFYVSELPWLGASDRTILEMAARLRAEMKTSIPPVSLMTELRQILNSLGATPAARSKVSAPKEDDDQEDPAAEFLN